jgi:biotin carboxylase
MAMPESRPVTILCLSSYFKGEALLRAAKQQGCHVILVTEEKLANEPWPRDSIDEFFQMPNLYQEPDVTYAISYLARTRPIDQIVALDDFDVETAAALRDHMRLPGMGASLARHFRDKLAMRMQAHAAGLRVPEFTGVFNHDRLRAFMARVPPPWLLKPRSEASAMGIKKIGHPDELWPALDALGDRQSFFVLEQYLPGDVFHVDGLVDNGEVLFMMASRYGTPPMDVYHGGGVFITRTLDRESDEAQALFELNPKVQSALGMLRGATHTEYIRAHADRQFYFLETAARVGGAHIAEAVQYATGVNLWEEWAKIEIAFLRGETYRLPEVRPGYAGVINCLARQEWPDTSAYADPEVVWRLHKQHHAGLIVASPDAARVAALLNSYSRRFAEDFLAVAPPMEKARP